MSLKLKLGKIYSKLWLDVPYKLYAYHRQNKLTQKQIALKNVLQFFKPIHHDSKKTIVVAEVRDYEYVVKMAAVAKILADKNKASITTYNVYINKIDNWRFNKKEWFVHNLLSPNHKEPISGIYKGFAATQIHHNSTSFYNQSFILSEKNRLVALLKQMPVAKLNDLKIEDITIGDLIYDTYLRSFHQPTIICINAEIELVVEWALNIFYTFKEVLKNNIICALINTYSAYLHFGITTRLCIANGIKVYTVGSSSYRVQELTNDFPYHQVNHCLFSADKQLSANQINIAKTTFEKRFKGVIDGATSYMRQSAFSNTPIPEGVEQLFKLKPRNVVIYVHDFYDSPHVNRQLAFADLYKFLQQTLEALIDVNDTTIFIKTHPNGIAGCKEKTIELVNSFQAKHFIILDETVSNLHIVTLKPDLIATARGTVCVEMAYFGIPTVALFDNIFANFSFTHTCKNKEEYFNVIKGKELPIIDFDKQKIFSFYYQAYLEQLSNDNEALFPYLTGAKINTYSDEYIDHLLKRKNDLFGEKFLNNYIQFL